MLTRARSGLIVIGNASTVCREKKTWSQWLTWAIAERCVYESGDKLDFIHSCKLDREALRRLGLSRLRAIERKKGAANWDHLR
mmetsp:Transcript_18881/g.35633  ORF Transcript_18881/g.35633 Transcript_18881/m.35633 type:complete len:83 (+) Transcript_18881:158-406(+)